MMEAPSSCSSSRVEAFPAGLRVLVVDDDPTWLKILEKMLRKCSYEVTTCGLARAALEMLRRKRGTFDIVISDVNMPDMDGFKLLEQVGLEMDLPVIMMSVDGETSRVMKGVQHGACDYLLKPVRMKELRNIWQHVFRKKIHEIKEVEEIHDDSSTEEFQFLNKEFAERQQMFYAGDLNSTQKRIDMMENRDNFVEPDFFDHASSSSVKKARVIWTVDLHQKFVDAVNQIGFDKVGPKKILDLMSVPGLTRENVASHLQKYRLYLSRLQKRNYGIAIGGATKTDAGLKDSTTKFVPKIPKPVSHSNGKRNHVDVAATMKTEDTLNRVISRPKHSSIKVFGSSSSKKTVIPNSEYQMQQHGDHFWNEGIAAIPFTQYSSHFSHSIPPDYQHQHMQQQMSSESKQNQNVGDIRSNHSVSKQANLISVQVDHGLVGSKNYGIGPSDVVDQQQQQQQCLFDSLDHPQLQKTVPSSSSQYGYLNNIDVNTMDIRNYNNSTQITQLQGELCNYDGLQLDCEYVFELMKYPSDGAATLYT